MEGSYLVYLYHLRSNSHLKRNQKKILIQVKSDKINRD